MYLYQIFDNLKKDTNIKYWYVVSYNNFRKFLEVEKPVIGMIHISALPGTPKNKQNPDQIIESAIKEALSYKSCGLKAVMIENMHDLPYLKSNIGHEISAVMAIIGHEIKFQPFETKTIIQME